MSIPDESENKKRKMVSPKEQLDEKRPKKELDSESSLRGKALDLSKAEKVSLRIISLINNKFCWQNLFILLQPQKPPTVTKKELARQKAASGSKSITNFFKKK